jgi:hypothetical protein
VRPLPACSCNVPRTGTYALACNTPASPAPYHADRRSNPSWRKSPGGAEKTVPPGGWDWRARRDSNPRPSVPKTDALFAELRARPL